VSAVSVTIPQLVVLVLHVVEVYCSAQMKILVQLYGLLSSQWLVLLFLWQALRLEPVLLVLQLFVNIVILLILLGSQHQPVHASFAGQDMP